MIFYLIMNIINFLVIFYMFVPSMDQSIKILSYGTRKWVKYHNSYVVRKKMSYEHDFYMGKNTTSLCM